MSRLWQRAGRLVGVEPVLVARRGRVRPPTKAEAAAMLEAAIAALEAAGVPVRVLNLEDCAVVLIQGAKWRKDHEPQGYLVDLDPVLADADGVHPGRPEPVRAADGHAHAGRVSAAD